MKFLPLFLLIPGLIIAQSHEYATIHGSVVSHTSGDPLEKVNIILEGTRYGGTTNDEGEYTLYRVPPGKQTIVYSHVGYAVYSLTQYFKAGEEYTHNVALFEQTIHLDRLEIVEDRFLEDGKRRAADSFVISGEQIRESGVQSFGDVLRIFLPRAAIYEDGHDLNIRLMRGTSITQRYHGAVNPLIILNGHNIGNVSYNLNLLIDPRTIIRMEVIRGPSARGYGKGGEHGVILIDTESRQPQQGVDIRSTLLYFSIISYVALLFLWQ